jgi:hypothetical protein
MIQKDPKQRSSCDDIQKRTTDLAYNFIPLSNLTAKTVSSSSPILSQLSLARQLTQRRDTPLDDRHQRQLAQFRADRIAFLFGENSMAHRLELPDTKRLPHSVPIPLEKLPGIKQSPPANQTPRVIVGALPSCYSFTIGYDWASLLGHQKPSLEAIQHLLTDRPTASLASSAIHTSPRRRSEIMNNIGYIYLHGLFDTTSDPVKAVEWFKKSAFANDELGCFNYGCMLLDGV